VLKFLHQCKTHRRLNQPSFIASTYTTALQKVLKFLLDIGRAYLSIIAAAAARVKTSAAS
jgi:hypothetical protein